MKTPQLCYTNISHGTRGKVKNIMRAGRIRFIQLVIAQITALIDSIVKMKFWFTCKITLQITDFWYFLKLDWNASDESALLKTHVFVHKIFLFLHLSKN